MSDLEKAIQAATAGIMLYDRDLWKDAAEGWARAAIKAAWPYIAELERLEKFYQMVHDASATIDIPDEDVVALIADAVAWFDNQPALGQVERAKDGGAP